jgi:hypothetical protein
MATVKHQEYLSQSLFRKQQRFKSQQQAQGTKYSKKNNVWDGAGIGHTNYYGGVMPRPRQDSNAEWTFAEWTFLNGPAPRHSGLTVATMSAVQRFLMPLVRALQVVAWHRFSGPSLFSNFFLVSGFMVRFTFIRSAIFTTTIIEASGIGLLI